MTTSVDVLLVLETQAAMVDWLTNEEIAGGPLRRVRAAVAELIEAAEIIECSSYFIADRNRLKSAIARVKGEPVIKYEGLTHIHSDGLVPLGRVATQEMVDAGAAALLAYRKSGGDYRVHPTHAVEAAINAALAAADARVKGA